ncbi:MAG: Rieske 2Fe-2S domain-containing protein [Candidatus Acidiferrales bacterium]
MKATKRWVQITSVESIPLREGRSVQVGEHEVAIFNLGDRFLAVGNRCPHRGGPLAEGIVSGATVVCPLHAWKVSLETGSVVSAPNAPNCVEAFHTCVKDGFIFLEMPLASKAKEESSSACVDQERPASWFESSAVVQDNPDLKNIGV